MCLGFGGIQMWELDEMVSLRYIKETIRLARYPMDFILIEGADVRPTPAEIATVVGADEVDPWTDSRCAPANPEIPTTMP